MRLALLPLLFFSLSVRSQINLADPLPEKMVASQFTPSVNAVTVNTEEKIRIHKKDKWKLTKNMIWTGGLVFTAGAAKGFNEALQYKYNGFEEIFPRANDQWFYPTFSYNNKYKDNDPSKGPKFPLSNSLLVMFTDQYHLNNFIHYAALSAALVIKIGDKKRPLKHYIFDALYYTACYQLGFQALHAPIAARN